MSKKWTLSLFVLLCTAVLASGWALRSQQNTTREKRPPKPGTLRAFVEDPNVRGDIRLPLYLRYAGFRSLDAMADASDAVVVGKVEAFRSFPCNDMTFVCTQFRFKVTETLAGEVRSDRRGKDRIPAPRPGAGQGTAFTGPGPDEIVVTQAGGQIIMEGRRIIAYVSDEQLLRKDHEYILFLNWTPEERKTTEGSNTYHIMGGPQGVLAVEGEEVKSMVRTDDTEHPIRFEVERLFKGNKELLRGRFEARRLSRRP